jgi:hypothetical protein
MARQSALERFEVAVKSRVQTGIADDNELRRTDEMLHAVVLGEDSLDHAKPTCDQRVSGPITEAYARHKAMLATVKPWKERWTAMRSTLTDLILKYNKAKKELARRQQEEIDRAAAAEQQRKEEEARALLRAGQVAQAKAMIREAQTTVAPVIATGSPLLAHSFGSQPWNAEVTDPDAVVKAIAAGIIPLSIIKEWDITFLKKEAGKRGGLPPTWAGVEAWQGEALRVRR